MPGFFQSGEHGIANAFDIGGLAFDGVASGGASGAATGNGRLLPTGMASRLSWRLLISGFPLALRRVRSSSKGDGRWGLSLGSSCQRSCRQR